MNQSKPNPETDIVEIDRRTLLSLLGMPTRREDLLNQENQELKKLLNRIAYSTSHEIRSPLATMRGLLDVIQREEPYAQNQYLEMLQKTVVRLDEYLLQIIQVMHNMETEVHKKPISLKKNVERAIGDLVEAEDVKNIKFFVHEVEEGKKFTTDPQRLELIIQKLVQNSIRYRSHHRPLLLIDVAIIQNPGKATIMIKDNASGIPEKSQSQIFDMYYKANQESKGAGLGLYIAQKTSKMLGGAIQLMQSNNEGSTFIINLSEEQN